ncbi:RecB family exonuclease [Nocardia terpenica]|uniref:PD-(D/E)XK endonuclease-like domain-containing protein n=1 Tax=Nocardia terpenica TaxID=455432 RepID=A0A291RU47_9NOCA|nr:PD-(D/E)XK nuclease family protein [Nocardia terpenica]ATL70754.1 hypothetical protein CRH09_35815 [Nocardia terpenica]
MVLEEAANKRRLSVSQYKMYEKCPYSWYLQKVERAWQRPAAWLAQGTAVHAAAEAYERSGRTLPVDDMKEVFRQSYAEEIGGYTKETPNFTWWFRSGPYGGARDIERRYRIGLEQTEKYPAWYEKHPHEVIWVAPDGTPGIELRFDIDLDGVGVTGFIDAIIADERTGELTVRDNKTGNTPGDAFQLGMYSVAVELAHGVERPLTGDYWMAKTGKPTLAYDLTEWDRECMTGEFHKLADNIRAERFDPDPEPAKCRFCSVSASCEFSL